VPIDFPITPQLKRLLEEENTTQSNLAKYCKIT